jgi:hypothetical protein
MFEYGAQSNIRKSALFALYLAKVLRLSVPSMTTRPSVVQTLELHTRPLFFGSVSKLGE